MSGDRTLGFSWPVLIALAALAAVRIPLHDLGTVEEGTALAAVLVVVPPACWVGVVFWRRPPHPFGTVVVIGALYGVFLAAGHQLFWDAAFAGAAPALGGRLAGTDPATTEVVLRVATAASSLVTGTLVGVVAGAVAAVLCRVVPERPSSPSENPR
ncbi:hypothetical protein [Actinomycetospora cinnamomea]|uniref:Uncharacterized protein n=1 Tax=Actinomycetospora cinnamomea TaxID=663609 RepID=A0A2U1FHT6_9PSEU|nr:hypothetical protein [Actinomycetospora cinnamomea]PVZ11727.1 hypothetical protein C8D89_10357 [Actinomycetospora cinnamomea]